MYVVYGLIVVAELEHVCSPSLALRGLLAHFDAIGAPEPKYCM
jgi:hypothetical protein